MNNMNFWAAAAAVSAMLLSSCGNAAKNNMASEADGKNCQPAMVEWARGANIYEVNVRQYTPEGTFKALQQHLPRLSGMGVDIVWLMPISPISEEGRKGSLGSYYAVKNYTEVNPEFGNLDDMKALVAEAHRLGMKVIIDWVANHTGRGSVWTVEHPEWFNKDSLGNITCPEGTDWTDVADLNYDVPEMRQAMIDAMKFWIENADIDGFRCDMAGMVPTDFWVEARKQLEAVKPIFMLAEDDKPEIHKAFDVSYNWEIHHCMNDIAQGKKNADSLIAIWEQKAAKFRQGDLWLNFTSNHDENSWSGTEYDRMGNYAEMMAALTYCLPGMPLTYSGQEAGNRKVLRFFDKDTLDFSQFPMINFYAKWNRNKKLSPDLNSNYIEFIHQDANVLMFKRDSEANLLFVFNFGDETTIDIDGYYCDLETSQTVTGPSKLAKYQYMILNRINIVEVGENK